ncbi:inhibitor of growth protein 3-like isoform X1 [Homalodisca vitripennis]|uniref:inhibitor of growth protein 3-like isoform X1 n=1 Tax=Homalodisca vitripennis TaxID=197043 RepID=UPI001EECE8EB|nr:inhibitor of growth protein 3-like isoform X1 [Homalodisca vitripennis]XP_046674149.1 inhibitor of growth protein 3-like isoform X1 [Homalodisca vitripennis]
MLYLEDYLELIEHLPQELRDRFTVMREMDLQVQNTTESLEKRVKIFFSHANEMNPQEKDAEYNEIKKDYYKCLEDADEKVQLSNQLYDLVALYLRRLEQECHKFKMELEADRAGITEILEKRSEEMDASAGNNSQKENLYSVVVSRPSASLSEKKRDTSISEYKRLLNVEKMLPDVRPMSAPANPPTVNYSLSHMGAGGTAIAAAATQAIVATQQMQQGRRTASLKASYEAINSIVSGVTVSSSHELGISKELAGAAQTAIAAIQDTSKKNKKKSSASSSSSQSSATISLQAPVQGQAESPTSSRNDSSYDPNEPRYCICNEVAYGGMVACDNKSCPHEWFHYPCVGITDPPKGSWYCPQCLAAKKRRVSRKKKTQPELDDLSHNNGIKQIM